MMKREIFGIGDGYVLNRIPGMIVTDNGTVIAYNEARRTAGDWGYIDIYMLRSEDYGQTFGEKIILAETDDNATTKNNPVMVQDNTGVIHFLYCENYGTQGGRILHRVSADDGKTWSEPIDISYATAPSYRNAFALGPGHGIVNATGDIVIPIWMVPKRYGEEVTSHHSSEVATIYSKDNGKTWALGEILPESDGVKFPNESEIALCSDGKVYINSRQNEVVRLQAYSQNGYDGWTALTVKNDLPDAICFGSVVRAVYKGKSALVFCNCANDERPTEAWPTRKKVTISTSYDDGKTWKKALCLDEENGGYVEMAVDNKQGFVYVIWEQDFGKKNIFVRLNTSEILL